MITLTLKQLPPSLNEAYSTFRGRRVLSAKGTAYKQETTLELQRAYPAEVCFFRQDIPYRVEVHLFFDTIFNKGWPKTAETRYKRVDADNRLKLLLDALSNAVGVDDAQFLELEVHKGELPKGQVHRVVIRVTELESMP